MEPLVLEKIFLLERYVNKKIFHFILIKLKISGLMDIQIKKLFCFQILNLRILKIFIMILRYGQMCIQFLLRLNMAQLCFNINFFLLHHSSLLKKLYLLNSNIYFLSLIEDLYNTMYQKF